jgi:hypothetical protein
MFDIIVFEVNRIVAPAIHRGGKSGLHRAKCPAYTGVEVIPDPCYRKENPPAKVLEES